MLINTYNFWNTFPGPITKSSNPTHAHTIVGTPPICTHVHPLGVAGHRPLLGECRSPHFSPCSWCGLSSLIYVTAAHHTLSKNRDWWKHPRGARHSRTGGLVGCLMLPDPGQTSCPWRGTFTMGLVPLQGFSHSTNTFHASFVFLFRLTPPLFQKYLLMPNSCKHGVPCVWPDSLAQVQNWICSSDAKKK